MRNFLFFTLIVTGAMLTVPVAAEIEPKPQKDNTMSENPKAVIEQLYTNFANGDIEATFAVVGDGFTMFEPGPKEFLPWAGQFDGLEGFKRFNSTLGVSLSAVSISETNFEEISGGRVIVTGTENGTSAATGKSYETQSLWIWTVKAGKVVGMRAYHDTEAMTRAFRP